MGEVTMKMPAGKFKGQAVEEVPSAYLRWWAEHGPERNAKEKALIGAVNTELEFRDAHEGHF